MYSVSAQFLDALRYSHAIYTRCDIVLNGTVVASNVDVVSGSVSVSSGTGVRRSLDIEFADRSLWEVLSVPGTEIRPYRGVRYPGSSVESVPLGVFRVLTHSMSEVPGAGVQVSSAPDRWSMIQQKRFEVPESASAGELVKVEIGNLVFDACGITPTITATSTATVGPLVYERDREKAIVDLATSIGAEVYFDVLGQPVVRDVPQISTPIWKVDVGLSGIMLSSTRTRDKSRAYNVVVFSNGNIDGEDPGDPVIVSDDDPDSPTYAAGPMGRVPFFYTSSTALDVPSRTAAAQALLTRVRGTNAQFDLTAMVNPALDRGDSILVKDSLGTSEVHLVQSLTVPLDVEGAQSISTQSSNPEIDETDPGVGEPGGGGTTPPPVVELVSAGSDATIPAGTTFNRTALEPAGTPTSRSWTIQSGPLGAGTVIGTAQTLSWRPGDSPVNTTNIRQPVCAEMAFQITSTSENSDTDWTKYYRYIEDINDNRGYTAGLVGFTSGTGDMLLVVQQYKAEKPTGNTLASYIPGLQTCASIGMGSGASAAAATYLGSGFMNAWRAAADSDPVFRKIQRDFRKSMYFDDALTQALADGVGPLGLALHYDILVNHGPGMDSESYGGIVAAARASTSKPPSAGGTEGAYLTKLCDLRDAVLVGWGDFQSNGRSTIYRKLINEGKFSLIAPFSWSVYGDTFTMNARPAVSADSVVGNYVLLYKAVGLAPSGGDTVSIVVT